MTRTSAFPGATPDDWAAARAVDPTAFGPGDTWNVTFRCFAIRRPGNRFTIVDTGIGPVGSVASWAPLPGHLPQSLADAGIDPDDVDTVVFTHLHEDHTGWAVGLDGVPLFESAQHVVQSIELAALEAGGGPVLTQTIEPLRNAGLLRPVDGRVRLPGLRRRNRHDDAEIAVTSTPGHTPGHQSVLVDGGDTRVIITGDVLVHVVQLVAPEVAYVFESDPDTARQTRQNLLADAAHHDSLLATAHLSGPFVRPGDVAPPRKGDPTTA